MKTSFGVKLFRICNAVFMLLLCFAMLYPYLNQLAISLNEGMDTSFGGITIFPRKWTWANYEAILKDDLILRSTFITLISVIARTVLSLVVCVGAAYAVNKRDLPFRDFLIWFLLIPMYIGAGVIPTYILYRYLGLLNNIMVYIVPGLFSFYNMIVIRTFLKGLPVSLEESAMLDGANEIQVLFKIILPLCKPVLATVALWVSVETWNNWTTTLMYVNEQKLSTLQYVIMQIIKQSEVVRKMAAESAMMGGDSSAKAVPTSDSIKAAGIIFSTLPIVMVYPFLQKYFVQGVTIGAVKE